MPYKNVGAVKNASTEVVMNLELDNDTANITVYSPIQLDDVTIKFVYRNKDDIEESNKHIYRPIYLQRVLFYTNIDGKTKAYTCRI